MKRLITVLALLTFSSVALAGTITATTDKAMSNKERAFARDYPVNSYCGNDPESWVRGRADFDTASGNLHMEIQLETDATHAGPKGQLVVTLYDKDGDALAVATSKVVGAGGKRPGRAARRTFHSTRKVTEMPASLYAQVASAKIRSQCRGSVNRIFNIDLGDAKNAFDFMVKVLSAAGGTD